MTYHLTLGAGRARLYWTGNRWVADRMSALIVTEWGAEIQLGIACRTHPEAVATEWGR